MVQVGCLVQQFRVGEEQEERGDGEAVAIAERDAGGGEPHQREVRLHAPVEPGANPPEPRVGEMMLRRDIEVVDPAARRERTTVASASAPNAMRNAAADCALTGRDPASATRSSAAKSAEKPGSERVIAP